MKTPNYVLESLNAASGMSRCYVNNQKAQEWLTKNLSLFTDDNEHELDCFTVDFCWKLQKWFVKTKC